MEKTKKERWKRGKADTEGKRARADREEGL